MWVFDIERGNEAAKHGLRLRQVVDGGVCSFLFKNTRHALVSPVLLNGCFLSIRRRYRDAAIRLEALLD